MISKFMAGPTYTQVRRQRKMSAGGQNEKIETYGYNFRSLAYEM